MSDLCFTRYLFLPVQTRLLRGNSHFWANVSFSRVWEFMWASFSGLPGHGFSFSLFLPAVTLKNKFRFGVDNVRLGIVPSFRMAPCFWEQTCVCFGSIYNSLKATASGRSLSVEHPVHAFGITRLPLSGELSGKWIYQGCECPLHRAMFMEKVWLCAGPPVNLEHPEGKACMSESAPGTAVL